MGNCTNNQVIHTSEPESIMKEGGKEEESKITVEAEKGEEFLFDKLDKRLTDMPEAFVNTFNSHGKIIFGQAPDDYRGPIIPRKFVKWRCMEHD